MSPSVRGTVSVHGLVLQSATNAAKRMTAAGRGITSRLLEIHAGAEVHRVVAGGAELIAACGEEIQIEGLEEEVPATVEDVFDSCAQANAERDVGVAVDERRTGRHEKAQPQTEHRVDVEWHRRGQRDVRLDS